MFSPRKKLQHELSRNTLKHINKRGVTLNAPTLGKASIRAHTDLEMA